MSHPILYLTFKLFIILMFLFGGNQSVIVQAQEIVESADSVKKVINAIPMIEIPQKAFELMQDLQSDISPVLAKPVVSETQPEIDSLQLKIDHLSGMTESILEESLPYTFYQSVLIKWSRLSNDISYPEKKLQDQSVLLESADSKIKDEVDRWNKTKENLQDKDTPEDILLRVDQVKSVLDSTSQILIDSASQVLHWLDQIAQMKLIISDYITRLDVTKQMQLYDLLIVRTEPIWSIKIKQDSTNVFALNEALYSFGIDDSKEYLTFNKSKFMGLGILFLIFLSVLYWLRIKYRTLSDELKLEHTTGEFIVSRPIISAIMLMLLWALWTLPQMPHFLDNLVSILFLVPFLFIFHRIVQKPLRGSLYYFFVIFLIVNLSPFFYIGDAISRIALIIESLFIAGFLFWFIRKKKSITPENRTSGFWYQFLNLISPVYLVIMVAAIIANIIGYENLNNLVTYGILVSLLLGLIFGTAYFALRGLTLLFTATTLIRVSNIVKKDQNQFLTFFDKTLWTATVIIWFYFTLRSFQLWEPFYKWFRSVLEIGYGFGNIQITIGGIINFFLIIIFSWLLSRFIRLILQDEILQRFNLPRGIPMAISSLTQYTLIFIGFVLALAYAGFDLQNLGIMAGALGVGIGFGLQNLVGNFISGLILVFERPVAVGDIVKLDLYEGTVVNIGIRSSIIRQWDGSRIIVPNSDLISYKVLNWSMTNYQRRFIIKVHTPPDTDPDLVIKLMTEAAAGEELVLKNPAPTTYFLGIVDQAYAFDLFFWVSKEILIARSNVNLAVQKTLKEAGIKVLLPKKLEIQEAFKTPSSRSKKPSGSSSRSTKKPDLEN